MKHLRLIIAAAALFCLTAGAASAVDIKVKGEWDFAFGWADNTNFYNGRASNNPIVGDYADNDNFYARQRVRTQINFIASEQLQGVLMFEIGDINWGRNENGTAGQGAGGALDADGVNVETKRAYLDWMIPETSVTVRMGIQGVSLPMANGYCNPVFSADVAGIVVNAPITDMIGITAFWLRPFDRTERDGGDPAILGDSWDDEMDMFGLTLPITGEGWSATPWGMYARIGNASEYYDYYGVPTGAAAGAPGWKSNDGADAWWAGVSVQVDVLDPLSFGFDIMYGSVSSAEIGMFNLATPSLFSDFSTKGWFAEAALNYTLDWGTPGIFGWYASGDDYSDAKDGQFGRMPVVGTDDGFGPTSFGFPGSYGIGADSLIGVTGVGTWGIGVQIADISFVEDLSHTLRLAYYRGTNDSDMVKKYGANAMLGGFPLAPPFGAETWYLTDKDYAWEVNFDHQYKIYENLTAVLELGYINLNLDEDVRADHNTDDAWKAQLLFNYSF